MTIDVLIITISVVHLLRIRLLEITTTQDARSSYLDEFNLPHPSSNGNWRDRLPSLCARRILVIHVQVSLDKIWYKFRRMLIRQWLVYHFSVASALLFLVYIAVCASLELRDLGANRGHILDRCWLRKTRTTNVNSEVCPVARYYELKRGPTVRNR